MALGKISETTVREILKPDFMGRIGFPAYALSNDTANIHRMKERLIELEKREVTPTGEITFTGGSIVDNREEDRVQIFFDQKPPQAMIDKLKSEGWRWAPSVGAWSRKRTDMAMNSARRITGAVTPAVQPPAVPQVPVRAAAPVQPPVMYVQPKYPPLLYPAPPNRPAEEIMFVPNPEKMTRDEYVKEKYKRMAQVLRQQGKNAIAERVEKGARDPERTFKYETSHRDQVVLALAQGKTVGGGVLKDYPDIVARIRQENEALLAKDKAERERLLAIERAEENELNAELNRLPPPLKRHAETEIYGTLHMPETHKDYRNRYVIALGKVRRIAFTHLPQGKEPQPSEVRKEEPVEPLLPEQERVIKTYLDKRGHELTLRDFIWADKYTIRGTAKYPIRTMEEKRKREEFVSKNYDEETGKKYHRGTVESALKRGLKVPEEVLKDYPDLIAKKKEPWEITQEEYWRAGAEGRAFEGRGTSDYSHRQAVSKAIIEGKPVPANVLKDYPDLVKKEVPEPTGYFTLRKAQELTRENKLKLSDKQLHEKSIQIQDYIRLIEGTDEYSRKTLVKGGYYAGVIHPDATGIVPVDIWLLQNLKFTLGEFDKEQQRRKQEKEKVSLPAVPVAKPFSKTYVQRTFTVEERMRRYGYA